MMLVWASQGLAPHQEQAGICRANRVEKGDQSCATSQLTNWPIVRTRNRIQETSLLSNASNQYPFNPQ
jgi:hypothetical protein